MKAIIGLLGIQTVILFVLVFKVISLENKNQLLLQQYSQVSSMSLTETTRPEDAALYGIASVNTGIRIEKPLGADDIRKIISSELKLLRDQLEDFERRDIDRAEVDNRSVVSSDPDTVMETSTMLDVFISDGHFSLMEQEEFESILARVSAGDRKRLLSDMSKKLSQANIGVFK